MRQMQKIDMKWRFNRIKPGLEERVLCGSDKPARADLIYDQGR